MAGHTLAGREEKALSPQSSQVTLGVTGPSLFLCKSGTLIPAFPRVFIPNNNQVKVAESHHSERSWVYCPVPSPGTCPFLHP